MNSSKEKRLSISKIRKFTKRKMVVPSGAADDVVINSKTNSVGNLREKTNRNIKHHQGERKRYEYKPYDDHDDIDSAINLREYLEVVFHYKWMIFIVFLTVLLAAIASAFLEEPVYKAHTQIFVQEDAMEMQVINDKPYFKQSYDLTTWIQILKSTKITRRIEEKLSHRVSAGTISGMLQYNTQKKEDHIIDVVATSLDPKLSADVANASYQALSEYDTEKRLEGYDYSLDYLEQLMRRKRKELDGVMDYINNFLQDKGIDINTINLENNLARVNELKTRIADCKVELAGVNASITKINSDLNREDQSIVNQTTYSEPYKIQLMNLETQKARAMTNYTERHPKILAIQKNINNVKKLIADGMSAKIQLKNVGANPIKQRLIDELLKNGTEKMALEQRMAALNKLLSEINISADYKKLLEDKFNKKQDLVLQIGNLQNQYNNAKINSNIATSKLYQLQEAVIPTKPIADNMKRNIIIGIVLGLGLGIGLALLLNSFNDTILSVGEYEGKYSIPVIGIIPKFKANPLLLMTRESKNHSEAKEFENDEGLEKNGENNENEGNEEQGTSDVTDKLADNSETVIENKNKFETTKKEAEELAKMIAVVEPIIINFKYLMLRKDQKIFAIQSALHKEGKSLLVHSMANSLAKENLNVLVVDTDFYKRTLTRRLDYKRNDGLSEVLSEQVSVNNVIVRNNEYKYWVLPAGKEPPNVLQMYRSPNFKTLLNKLKNIYDIVLVDTPAFLLVPSIAYFLSDIDGTIIPVRINYTTHSSLSKLIAKSSIYDINILGVIINFAQALDKKYYKYEYDYNYYYKNQAIEEEEEKSSFGAIRDAIKKKIGNINILNTSEAESKEVETEITEENKKRQIPTDSLLGKTIDKIKGFLFFKDEDDEQ